MNKIELTYSPYKLKLVKPLTTSRQIFKERKGFIIKLKSNSGKTGTGDAAPLPQLGSESFEDAQKKLDKIKLEFKIDVENVFEDIEESLSSLDKFPSLRHGLEQALLNLICNEKKITLNELLNRKSKSFVYVNAIIGFLSPEDSAQEAAAMAARGYKVLKIKMGRDKFERDLECIQAVKKAVGDKLRIRIDVNGKWKLNDAKNNLKALEDFDIEFAEQPVSRFDSFVKLAGSTSIPLAPDESIRSEKDADDFIEKEAAKFLILKPMMLGGIIPALKIIDKAKRKNIKTVITTSFDSAIGRSMAIFAASLIEEDIAHGLSTAEYFENDIAEDPYPVKDGKIFLT